MKNLNSHQIRKLWLDFFKKHDHLILKSQPLIPNNDSSLLFINSGVATLKAYFSNQLKPPYPNLANSQKCLRTNDIENVGKTARHHTFFEMLGSFSIGGYQKEHAIELAYQFIFDVLKLPKEKIYITYHDQDSTTYKTWKKLGIGGQNLIKGNDNTNFWDLGRGPCGYDTEIFYDRGIEFDPQKKELELLEKDLENDRYLEIWNIVFSEFNHQEDGSYQELEQKNIDTGAGLERIVALFAKSQTNFETDLFLPIIEKIEKDASYTYLPLESKKEQQIINCNYRIIADHIRAIALAIQDGVIPSNTGRGYIIRRLIRRAHRARSKLGIDHETYLDSLIPIVTKILDIYPIDTKFVMRVVSKEERVFSKTIKQGEQLLLLAIKNKQKIDSNLAFKLFETYGYPLELTQEIANEHQVVVDLSQIKTLIEKHRQVSQVKFGPSFLELPNVLNKVKQKISSFIGYDKLEVESKIVFQTTFENQTYLLSQTTPFYATSGGQFHDQGTINNLVVQNVFKDKYDNHWHILDKPLAKTSITLKVDPKLRIQSARNHSATHLLGKALEVVLGKTNQLGSENNPQKLRLDFPAEKKPTSSQIESIENLVNQYIKENHPRAYIETTLEKAKAMGAWILPHETYNQKVRVVDFGISKELCGGTHVSNTSQIEQFKIIKVDAKGSGIYRIEAITSNQEIKNYLNFQLQIKLKTIEDLIAKNKKLKDDYQVKKFNQNSIVELDKVIHNLQLDHKKLFKDKKTKLEDFNLDLKLSQYQKMPSYVNLDLPIKFDLRILAIQLRQKYPQAIIILGQKKNKQQLLAISSLTYDSKKVLDQILEKYTGNGGGQKILAMGKTSLITSLEK